MGQSFQPYIFIKFTFGKMLRGLALLRVGHGAAVLCHIKHPTCHLFSLEL